MGSFGGNIGKSQSQSEGQSTNVGGFENFNQGGGQSSNFQQSGGQGEAFNQGSTFIDPSQSPFLGGLRDQGQALASQQLGAGSQYQQGIVNPATQAFQQHLTPQQNPFLTGQIEQGQRQIAENFNERLLPGIGSGANQAGQRGGGRQGVAEGIALRDANRQSSDFAQNLLGQDFQGQQNRSLNALTFADSIGGLAFSPLQNLQGILGAPTVLSQNQGGSQSQDFSTGGGQSSNFNQGGGSGFNAGQSTNSSSSNAYDKGLKLAGGQ